MNTDRLTIAMYLRVSDEDKEMEKAAKRESNSIANQRNLLKGFLRGMPEAGKADILEFCDDGCSGKNFDRPSARALLKKAEQGEIHCIVVKDFSRFGRDYLAVGNYIFRIFPFWGVRFISVNDGFDSAVRREADSLTISFKTLLNDFYSQDLSRKVRSAQDFRAERGDFLSSFAPFGYRRDENHKNSLIPDEAAAEIVRRIFYMAVEGNSTAEIARRLNGEGILTPMLYKKAAGCTRKAWGRSGDVNFWTPQGVLKILRDERYTGKNIYGKRRQIQVGGSRARAVEREKWIVAENTHEGLVTGEEFDRAQEKIRRRERKKKPGNDCRRPAVPEKASAGMPEGAGAEKHYREKDVAAKEKNLRRLKNSLAAAKEEMKALYGQFALGEISKEEYLLRKEAMERKKEAVGEKLVKAEDFFRQNIFSPCQSAGEEGYAAIDIIRYYYGSDMYINTATSISGVPSSWPGYDLTIGSSGEKVRQMQQQLNRIARNYPAIPTITADGIFGPATANAVKAFQRIFNLPPNGIVDFPTWYSISNIYVGVSRISEPGT